MLDSARPPGCLIFDCGMNLFFNPSKQRQLSAIIAKIKDLHLRGEVPNPKFQVPKKFQIPNSKSVGGYNRAWVTAGVFFIFLVGFGRIWSEDPGRCLSG
jgi:hypothetical protein